MDTNDNQNTVNNSSKKCKLFIFTLRRRRSKRAAAPNNNDKASLSSSSSSDAEINENSENNNFKINTNKTRRSKWHLKFNRTKKGGSQIVAGAKLSSLATPIEQEQYDVERDKVINITPVEEGKEEEGVGKMALAPPTENDVTNVEQENEKEHKLLSDCCKCKCRNSDVAGPSNSSSGQLNVNPSLVEEDCNEKYGGKEEEIVEKFNCSSQGGKQGIDGNFSLEATTTNNNHNAPRGVMINAPTVRPVQHEDCDEAARLARAREIEEGVVAPPNFRSVRRVQLVCSAPASSTSTVNNEGVASTSSNTNHTTTVVKPHQSAAGSSKGGGTKPKKVASDATIAKDQSKNGDYTPMYPPKCYRQLQQQSAQQQQEPSKNNTNNKSLPAKKAAPAKVEAVTAAVEPQAAALAPIPRCLQLVYPPDLNVDSLRTIFQNHFQLRTCPLDMVTGCHTQVDFIHCLVPDLYAITNSSFYWGKMDRYEAEKLLEDKCEGTFLLRDSAQEEFLFSVSFRKFERSLHARIEQWNHKFSFDSHDPGVFSSDTVCGLLEHYNDASSCMFFEPVLTVPLHRKQPFSLQRLCRAVIVSRLTYDDISALQLPKTLKSYLKEYHYRQKVRVERFDDDVAWLDFRQTAGAGDIRQAPPCI